MTFEEKKERLVQIYERFETNAYPYQQDAVCKIGCSFCCTDAGRVDITTLEGLIIRTRLERLSEPVRKRVKRKIIEDRREKEKNKRFPCPFLKEDDTCLIYDVRPFVCRRLYSIQPCGNRGPTIHKAATDLASQTIKEIQLLDDTGYSGHISYILSLLEGTAFRKFYLSGGFNPGAIRDFGKAHALVINRFITSA